MNWGHWFAAGGTRRHWEALVCTGGAGWQWEQSGMLVCTGKHWEALG